MMMKSSYGTSRKTGSRNVVGKNKSNSANLVNVAVNRATRRNRVKQRGQVKQRVQITRKILAIHLAIQTIRKPTANKTAAAGSAAQLLSQRSYTIAAAGPTSGLPPAACHLALGRWPPG